jgi:thiol-disulfide isomerase/thioredoxin
MTRSDALRSGLGITLLGAAFAGPDGNLAPILRAPHWLGTRSDAAMLRGRVVLVDVFTFECINCVRVTPNLKRLYSRYGRSDLAIVAVHTPEVPSYQGRIAYLARQTRDAALPWPIAIDNDYRIWNAYRVAAWPTQLVFDRAGRLRATIVGDGRDGDVNDAVRDCVGRRGPA